MKKAINTCKELVKWWEGLSVIEKGDIIISENRVYDSVCWCKSILNQLENAEHDMDIEVDKPE